jgi:hypothetical protein
MGTRQRFSEWGYRSESRFSEVGDGAVPLAIVLVPRDFPLRSPTASRSGCLTHLSRRIVFLRPLTGCTNRTMTAVNGLRG